MNRTPVFIWQNRALKKIGLNDIQVLVTERNYTKIFISSNEYAMVRCTLDKALEVLSSDDFVRIHRSYAVAIHLIEEIHKDHVKILGQDIPLARAFYKPLLKKLQILG